MSCIFTTYSTSWTRLPGVYTTTLRLLDLTTPTSRVKLWDEMMGFDMLSSNFTSSRPGCKERTLDYVFEGWRTECSYQSKTNVRKSCSSSEGQVHSVLCNKLMRSGVKTVGNFTTFYYTCSLLETLSVLLLPTLRQFVGVWSCGTSYPSPFQWSPCTPWLSESFTCPLLRRR